LFSHAPLALTVVAVVGALTAFYAATIGLVQTDIKRVLAYSTVSQLGYMFLGLGAGAFAAGIFHLMTHAFFKALLFLAAGSVIHAMNGQQDILKMGGLRMRIPATYWTFLAGTLAIVGIPGFSGFFSKDEILWKTLTSTSLPFSWLLYPLALGAAALTSFYMFRLLFLVFHGEDRYTPETARHIHESPRVMTLPLAVLAGLSVVGGWVGLPAAIGDYLGISNFFEHFLEPVFASSAALLQAGAMPHTHAEELGLMGVAVLATVLGLAVAYLFYILNPKLADTTAETLAAAHRVLKNKYYVDEIYNAAVVQPFHWLSDRIFWQVVDVGIVDGAVNAAAARARGFGQRIRYLQSGNTRSYAAWVILGAVVVLSYFVFG
jgi:NADH-quinone oxidoreductase subunit L